MQAASHIDPDKLPKHIAIIMDGNGRWAKSNGKARIFGHEHGITSVRVISEEAARIGIGYLTLYTFSTENWNRPESEVTALMELLVRTIKMETPTLIKNNIRLNTIGNIQALPEGCYEELRMAMDNTARCTGMVLNLALNYSGRWDIMNATSLIAYEVQAGSLKPHDINDEMFSQYLSTAGMPDPELMIRTGGEERISNYLLWQSAYTEMYFTETYWPDFREEQLHQAIIDFQDRERRFGKISEQINK